MTKTVAVATLSLLVAAGCDSGLAAVAAPYLTTSMVTDSRVQVGVGPSGEGGCVTLGEDFQGTMNGVPLTVTGLGGRVPSDFFGSRCVNPTLEGDRPGPGTVSIRVWDSTKTIEAEFPALFDPRVLTLVAPADGTVFDGDRVQVAYTPATDHFLSNDGNAVDMTGDWGVTPAQREGGTFTFVAHKPLYGAEGRGLIAVGDTFEVPASHCTGASVCTAHPAIQPNLIDVVFVGVARGADATCSECYCVFSDDTGSGPRALNRPSTSPTACQDLCGPNPKLQRSFCSVRP